jgi:hypothetical protein
MTLRCFAHLKPLPGHLMGRTLAWCRADLPSQGPLPPKRAPRAGCRNVRRTQLEPEQRGHARHRPRALHAVCLFGDLRLAHAYHALQLFAQQLDPPSPQLDAHDFPRGYRLGPMGHPACGLFRPVVAPTCAQYHRASSQMAQPRSCGIDPKGLAAWRVDRGAPHLDVLPARQGRDEGFEGLPVGTLPGAGAGHHRPILQRLDSGQMGL